MAQEKTQQEQQEIQDKDEQAKKKEVEETEDPANDDGGDPKEPDSGLWEGISEDHPVRQVVKELRGEAAARRNEKKDLQQAFTDLEQKVESLKTPDEFQAAIEEANSKAAKAEQAATRERVGRTHYLPESLIPRLSGKTEEEMIADAKQLQEDLGIDPEGRQRQTPPPKSPPSGGLTPSERSKETQALVEKLRRGNRNF